MRNDSISKTCGLVIWLMVFALASCQNTSEEEAYNVILIMTDDQGYGDIGAHGNPILETPALDKLYNESIRFTDFHVNPFCAPTRAALMTGRHADLTHVRSTIYGRNHPPPNAWMENGRFIEALSEEMDINNGGFRPKEKKVGLFC